MNVFLCRQRLSAIFLALCIVTPGWTFADSDVAKLCIFGDSLSDSGNVFVLTRELSTRPYALIPSAPYPIGGITFSNGPTWIQQLAKSLGLPRDAKPAFRVRGRFCNYAFGGARARQRDPAQFDLPTQVTAFLADFATDAEPDTVYGIFIGGNDIRDALVALGADPTGTTSTALLTQALTSISGNILALYNLAQARRLLVLNAPNVALTPAVRLQGPPAAAAAMQLSIAFNAGLSTALDALESLPDIEIIRVDVFSLLNQIVTNPPPGITNVTDSCLTPGVRRKAICADPDQYTFWDGIHPTKTVHTIIAEAVGQALSH